MSSQHADPQLNVRPPAAVMEQAKQHLAGHGREVRGFVVACLGALNANPDAFLAQLAEYWPADKPRGRPRRAPAAEVNPSPEDGPATSTAASVGEPMVGPGSGQGGDGGGRRRGSVLTRGIERPEPVDVDTVRLERVSEPGSAGWRVLAGLAADPSTVIVVGVLEPVYGTGRRGVRGWAARHRHVQVAGGPWRTRREAVGRLLLQHQRLAGA